MKIPKIFPMSDADLQYFDREGNVITFQRWEELSNDEDYRRIDITIIESATVSTLWIGFNLGASLDSFAPLIFETMVFFPDSDLDQVGYRSATESEALEMHRVLTARIVQEIAKQENNEDLPDEDI